MGWFSRFLDMFRHKPDPAPVPAPAPVIAPTAPAPPPPVAAPAPAPAPAPEAAKPVPPPTPAVPPAGPRWEPSIGGWVDAAGNVVPPPPLTPAQRVYRISETPYYLAKTGQASDPQYSELIDAWNDAGAAARAWRLANADFNGRFHNARQTILNLAGEQYPAQLNDLKWSNDSAEAENPGRAPYNG